MKRRQWTLCPAPRAVVKGLNGVACGDDLKTLKSYYINVRGIIVPFFSYLLIFQQRYFLVKKVKVARHWKIPKEHLESSHSDRINWTIVANPLYLSCCFGDPVILAVKAAVIVFF